MFDDRLATVLRMRAGSEAALRTQFRQLLDLLGTRETHLSGRALARLARLAASLPDAERDRLLLAPALSRGDQRLATISGFARLHALQMAIPQEVQSAILREPGLRLRNPQFVAFLAEGEPKPAAAAVATARLSQEQWLDLIPRLPVTARGFLRHRRNLPPAVKDLLARLGVNDLVLPASSMTAQQEAAESNADSLSPAEEAAATVPPATPAPREDGISALRRRIEAFRETRQQGRTGPRQAANDAPARESAQDRTVMDVVTGPAGDVVRADGFVAPMLAGLVLTSPAGGSLVQFGPAVAARLRGRLALRGAVITIDAAPDISGEWRMDATPLFGAQTGEFAGYAARLYRPNRVPAAAPAESGADAMRQVLHELRTPVNAIQGFAEIIQQQIFGPVPHEYRAHAAAIAGDAATLLAGFEEVERLVKLESGAQALEEGTCDLREALSATVRRLDGALRSRGAGFAMRVSGSSFTVAFDRSEALALCWRLLATAANALGPGEQSEIAIASDGMTISVSLDVPASLRDAAPDTSRDGQRRRAISAGMFGPRFSFRLAEVEAQAAGGSLDCKGDRVTLRLPALTDAGAGHSSEEGIAEG